MSDEIWLAVAGAHLTGMPLNAELTHRGARLVRVCRSSPEYQLFALRGTQPAKPGLVRQPGFSGPGIALEVWALTPEAFGDFVAQVAAPMTIGNVTLDDGTRVKGFSCEPYALADAEDITAHGGWKAFVESRRDGRVPGGSRPT